MTQLAELDRGVVEVNGDDRVSFLQGLVSNDVAEAAPGRAVWAALLTPQGKYLSDFFILADGSRLLLDCGPAQAPSVTARLSRFRLRSRVTVRDVSEEWRVFAAWEGPPSLPADAVAAPDPRLELAGWRVLSTSALPTNADFAAWDSHRLALGLPDGLRDLEADRTVLLEAGFDELRGVSWSKGCYMGQELTARSKYRGLIKRRLLPVAADGEMPASGTAVFSGAREVGTLRSAQGGRALATLRLDALNQPLTCGAASLRVSVPGWMSLPLSTPPG